MVAVGAVGCPALLRDPMLIANRCHAGCSWFRRHFTYIQALPPLPILKEWVHPGGVVEPHVAQARALPMPPAEGYEGRIRWNPGGTRSPARTWASTAW